MSKGVGGTDPLGVADLRQGGVLSQRLPGYQERPAQIEMATLVAEALTSYPRSYPALRGGARQRHRQLRVPGSLGGRASGGITGHPAMGVASSDRGDR